MADNALIVDTGSGTPDRCVIWLHGLGADGHDFEPIVAELRLDPELNIRFIFPHAPMMPVTINQGFVMRAWYDIRSPAINAQPDEEGIRQSMAFLAELIAEQVGAGIEAARIVLAGFSQGGAIALETGLRQSQTLAGIMALSTYLPMANQLAGEKTAASQQTPIFLAHGSIDPVVPVELAYRCRATLEKSGYRVEWHEYEYMPHSVSLDEILDIGSWLNQVLA